MNATECFKYEQPCILNEVIQARDKEEIIDQHLQCMQPVLYVLYYNYTQDNLVKPVPERQNQFWILMKQEMMGWQCISWTICKPFALQPRQITTPAAHQPIFLCQMFLLPPNCFKALKAYVL